MHMHMHMYGCTVHCAFPPPPEPFCRPSKVLQEISTHTHATSHLQQQYVYVNKPTNTMSKSALHILSLGCVYGSLLTPPPLPPRKPVLAFPRSTHQHISTSTTYHSLATLLDYINTRIQHIHTHTAQNNAHQVCRAHNL